MTLQRILIIQGHPDPAGGHLGRRAGPRDLDRLGGSMGEAGVGKWKAKLRKLGAGGG